MLYRFQSRETAELLMLPKDAQRILELLGKDPHAPGVITWPEIPEAIARLQAEAQAEREQAEEAATHADGTEDADPQEPGGPRRDAVTLQQRITPLVAALERCHRAQKDMVWTF